MYIYPFQKNFTHLLKTTQYITSTNQPNQIPAATNKSRFHTLRRSKCSWRSEFHRSTKMRCNKQVAKTRQCTSSFQQFMGEVGGRLNFKQLLMATRNPVDSLVEVGSLSHYLQVFYKCFIHPRWWRISSIHRIVTSTQTHITWCVFWCLFVPCWKKRMAEKWMGPKDYVDYFEIPTIKRMEDVLVKKKYGNMQQYVCET